MKAIKLFFMAAAMLLLVSCGEEKVPAGPDYQEMTFNATPATVNGVDLQFSTGESISVFDGKANQKFTAASATSFTGTADANAESFSVIYPYNASYKRTSGKVNVTIPAAQKPAAGSLDPAAIFEVAYAASKDAALNFVFMPALVKITVAPGEEIVSAQVVADGNETLSGTVTLDLSATPSCTQAGEGSNKVTITSEKLEGSYYVAVAPGTVSSFTVCFTDATDSRCEIKVAGAELKSGAVTDLGTFDSFEWVEAENPNPTNVAKNVIIKASFAEADFNVLSEPSFEYYPEQDHIYRSEWHRQGDPDQITTTTYNGEQFCRMVPTTDPWAWHRVMQVIPLEMDTEYEYSFYGNSNARPYWGFNLWEPDAWFETPFDQWVEHAVSDGGGEPGSYNAEVKKLSMEFYSGDSYFADMYLGFWGNGGCTLDFKDLKVVPKGYDKKSMKVANVESLGSMKNATFDDLTDVERFVVWDDATAGTINVACSKATISGTFVDNAVAFAKEASSASDITIGKFNKAKGLILPAVAEADGIINMVPDAAINVGGKTYMHYYAETAPAFMRPDGTALERYIAYSGFVVSEDGGKTWNLPDHGRNWVPFDGSDHIAYWPNSYTCFAQASLCQKGDYVYMLGTLPGRYPNVMLGWAETKRTFFAARAAATSDISDPQNWEYWTGREWAANEADPNIKSSLTAGTWAEPCVVYNPKFDRFMMIYRSYEGALVFKDADKIEGPWSGTKILVTDEEFGQCYAASVIKVDENGDLYIVASQF
ncbi:MAG: DUF4185 domain-containing protein [Bacteroidales bacterium]|nr:DUF4185 domain-containing protein [Candidatus Equibacterium intestinale]